MAKMTRDNELIKAMREAVKYMQGQQEGSVTYEIKVPDRIDESRFEEKQD